jgi:hypothetical protein
MWLRQDLGDWGQFRGVWVAGGFRFVGNRPTSDTYRVSNYTASANTTTFTGGTLGEPWRLQSYTVGDLGFGGRFQFGKVRYGLSASLKNITDETYLIQRLHFGAPRTWELRVSTSF